MQMRAGAIAGAAGEAQRLPRPHLSADGYSDLRKVRVERFEPMSHADEHDVAVAVERRRVADRLDDTLRSSGDIERAQRADVDAGMPLGSVVAEAACNRSARGPLERETLTAIRVCACRRRKGQCGRSGGDEPQ